MKRKGVPDENWNMDSADTPQIAPWGCMDAICQAYGLSRRETKFAQVFVQHCDLMKTAESLCISINTAKTHLQHIFIKTGCKKQTELVKLLLSGEPPSSNESL